MPYSTGCTTPLSNFEAGLNYKDVPDPAVKVSFPLDDDEDNAEMVIWTTTPWYDLAAVAVAAVAAAADADADAVAVAVADADADAVAVAVSLAAVATAAATAAEAPASQASV